ncbi:MAG: hypothetical protein ACE5FT_05155 [Candidatus Nanoarchaeia archaeon]
MNNNETEALTTKELALISTPTLASVISGAYAGYCHANGVGADMAVVAPAITQAVLGAGILGIVSGNEYVAGMRTRARIEQEKSEILGEKAAPGKLCDDEHYVPVIRNTGLGAITGAVKGGIETSLGYGLGYLLANTLKF